MEIMMVCKAAADGVNSQLFRGGAIRMSQPSENVRHFSDCLTCCHGQ